MGGTFGGCWVMAPGGLMRGSSLRASMYVSAGACSSPRLCRNASGGHFALLPRCSLAFLLPAGKPLGHFEALQLSRHFSALDPQWATSGSRWWRRDRASAATIGCRQPAAARPATETRHSGSKAAGQAYMLCMPCAGAACVPLQRALAAACLSCPCFLGAHCALHCTLRAAFESSPGSPSFACKLPVS